MFRYGFHHKFFHGRRKDCALLTRLPHSQTSGTTADGARYHETISATGERTYEEYYAAGTLKLVIIEVLKANKEPMTITEMMKADETLGGLTNQKISAIIRQMIKEETVERLEDKKKAMFTVK